MKAKNLNSKAYWKKRGLPPYETNPTYMKEDLDQFVYEQIMHEGESMQNILETYPYLEVFGNGDDSYRSDEEAGQ